MVKKSASAPTKKPGGATTKRKPTNGATSSSSSSSSKPRKPAPPPSSSGAQKPSASDPRPEKPPPSPSAAAAAAADLRAQQALLDVFADVFAAELGEPATATDKEEASPGSGSGSSFARALRDVKHALYERDFAAAFGREEYLRAYAARWSPTRALCYARVLRDVAGYLGDLQQPRQQQQPPQQQQQQQNGVVSGEDGGDAGDARDTNTGTNTIPRGSSTNSNDDDDDDDEKRQQQQHAPELRVLAIGGGAAETAALGAYLSSSSNSSIPPSLRAHLQLLDTGPWGAIIANLATRLATAPRLSKYASAALVAPPDRLRTAFLRRDVLGLGTQELRGLLVRGPPQPAALLITLLFTLNELYTAGGVGPTTAFLRRLTAAAPAGALLLVVDSPGSYSEAAVGGRGADGGTTKKKYPMQWLLDHTLLRQDRGRWGGSGQEGKGEEDEGGADDGSILTMVWEKLESADSVWFRLAEGLRYPIQLENMRYQMHLYRARRASWGD